jgi:hypothetical protein
MRLGLAGDAWDRQVTRVATKIMCRQLSGMLQARNFCPGLNPNTPYYIHETRVEVLYYKMSVACPMNKQAT